MESLKIDGGISQTDTVNELRALAGKYLTFKLDSEEFGIGIKKVKEIITMQTVTKIPRTPEYVRGVINLRGKVIPVIDLRVKFGMKNVDDSERTCIVVVNIDQEAGSIMIGIIIDEVKEVFDIKSENIEKTPDFGSSVNTEFILGIGKTGATVKMLLDIDKVLSVKEISQVSSIANS